MNDSKKIGEQVIVGWGLAGTVFAWQLFFQNIPFRVKDSLENHSTRIAAGLVNPIVFKRLTKSWNADLLMPSAESFYAKIEDALGYQLLSRKPILRIFASTEEENNWSSKQGDDRFSEYLSVPEKVDCPQPDFVHYPHGIGAVATFGNLDTALFMDLSKTFFLANGISFDEGFFDPTELDATKNYIFCEGTGMMQNPLFSYLPMNPTHGEVLIIQTDELVFDGTLNKNMFVMRLSENTYKVGATYNWELDKPVTTDAGKADLIERLGAFTSFKYTILDHQAGIRPTVLDRKPLVGEHPIQNNAYIFNGLGTKGVMIAPYYAEQLVNLIVNNHPIDAEVDIKRYQDKWKD